MSNQAARTTTRRAGFAAPLLALRAGSCRPRRLQAAAQVREAGFIDAFGDHPRQHLLAAWRRREGQLPVPDGAIAVGDRLQRQRIAIAWPMR